MADLLKFEADCQTIQIIANSIMVGGMPNSVNREMERRKYISKVGYLYPERDEKLRNVSDLRSLLSAVECTPYEKILSAVAMNDDRNEAESNEVGWLNWFRCK